MLFWFTRFEKASSYPSNNCGKTLNKKRQYWIFISFFICVVILTSLSITEAKFWLFKNNQDRILGKWRCATDGISCGKFSFRKGGIITRADSSYVYATYEFIEDDVIRYKREYTYRERNPWRSLPSFISPKYKDGEIVKIDLLLRVKFESNDNKMIWYHRNRVYRTSYKIKK